MAHFDALVEKRGRRRRLPTSRRSARPSRDEKNGHQSMTCYSFLTRIIGSPEVAPVISCITLAGMSLYTSRSTNDYRYNFSYTLKQYNTKVKIRNGKWAAKSAKITRANNAKN